MKSTALVLVKNFNFKSLALLMTLVSSPIHGFEYKAFELKVKNSYNVRNLVEKMPRKTIEEELRTFVANGRPSRLAGSPGHTRIQEYLKTKLQETKNAQTSFLMQEFSSDSKKGINFIWEKKGAVKPEEVIILGAHYDTLLKDSKTGKIILSGEMPGADNNASGVSILLSMIEILNKLDLPKTVRIVFFDLEEFDGQGSKFYAQSLGKEMSTQNINGFVHLSMLAHDSRLQDSEKKFNNMKIYTRPSSEALSARDREWASLLVARGEMNYGIIKFAQAEHTGVGFPPTAQNFWGLGIPVVTMTQNRESDLNPRYMTSNDFVETLNTSTYINIFKYVTNAMLAWNYDVVK